MAKPLYRYKYGEEIEQIDIRNEVTKDFLSGKSEANQRKYQPKRRFKPPVKQVANKEEANFC